MRRQTVSLAMGLLTLVLVVSVARSQKSEGDAVAEITRLEQESVRSDLANDRSFSDKYLANNFTAGDSFGEWETKQSILKDMSDPQHNKTTKEEMSDLKVRVYGNSHRDVQRNLRFALSRRTSRSNRHCDRNVGGAERQMERGCGPCFAGGKVTERFDQSWLPPVQGGKRPAGRLTA